MIVFEIAGQPVPKGRPRFGRGRAWTPPTTARYERRIRDAAIAAGARPICDPVAIAIHARHGDRRRRDLDNVAKAATDALNGVAYGDDSQIRALLAIATVDRCDPGISIAIAAIDADADPAALLVALRLAAERARGVRRAGGDPRVQRRRDAARR